MNAEDAHQAWNRNQPAVPVPAFIKCGRKRDLTGSLAIRPIPLPCSKTPAEPPGPRLGGPGDAAPGLPTPKASARHNIEANTRLWHPLSTLHERRCRRPCKTRFRLAGCAFAGRASNPLDRFERFQDLHSILLSGAYPAARIVYSKPPFGSPEHVLAYLGRYTHRVAIANSRLVSADDTSVSFRWRDYRRSNASRVMSLAPDEFIRRFLIHTLPDGFHRIRHYGFLANGCRRARVATIRQLLPEPNAPRAVDHQTTVDNEPVAALAATRSRPLFDPTVCPCCGGQLRIVIALPAMRNARAQPCPDTS